MSQYTKITQQSWFSRLGGAVKGILFGLLLFIVAFPLLFWNEGRAVERYKTLKEGEGAVVSISSARLDPGSDGQLVHTSGRAEPHGELRDTLFNVSDNAITLRRKVEMYQWQERTTSEERTKLGGGTETITTYHYEKVWSENPINSSNFAQPAPHRNPGEMPYRSETWVSAEVTLGAYRLPQSMSERLSNFEPLPIHDLERLNLSPELRQRSQLHNGGLYLSSRGVSSPAMPEVGELHNPSNRGVSSPGMPEVGDLRITFERIGPTDISLVARQAGNSFEPYRTKAGGTISLLQRGTHSAEAMFASAHQSNVTLTWMLRLGGMLLMFIGLNMILRPLAVVADVLPPVGRLVAAGLSLVTLLLALFFSLLIIALAWLFYRPLLAIGLLAVAGAALFLTRYRVKQAPPLPEAAPGGPTAG